MAKLDVVTDYCGKLTRSLPLRVAIALSTVESIDLEIRWERPSQNAT